MNKLYEIISQIQKDFNCPVCGEKYRIGDIRLRGLNKRLFVIQTMCQKNHVALFVADFQEINKNIISENDVLNLKRLLLSFDGDFVQLWQK